MRVDKDRQLRIMLESGYKLRWVKDSSIRQLWGAEIESER